MPPVTHQRAAGLRVKLVAEIAVIDPQVIAAIQCIGNAAHPPPRFQIDFGHLAFPKRRFDGFLKFALDLFECFRDVYLLQHGASADNAACWEGVKELVGEDATPDPTREFIDPRDVVILKQLLLAAAHGGASLEDQVRETAVAEDVAGE